MRGPWLAALLAVACAEPAAPPEPEPEVPEAPPSETPSEPAPDDGFAPAPEGPAAPPDREGFESRWGASLRVDAIEPLDGRDDAAEVQLTAIASRGTLAIGLHTSWPRLFPEELVVELCPRGSARRIDRRPRRFVVCEGDRLVLRVPVASPPPEWADALAPSEGTPDDDGGPLRAIAAADLPDAVADLAPELGAPRSGSAADAVRVTYWMRAARPGQVGLALPLHFSSPAIRVVARGEPITERVDLAGDLAEPSPRELRVGDEIAIGYLRP